MIKLLGENVILASSLILMVIIAIYPHKICINYPPTGLVAIYHPEFSINYPSTGPVAIYHPKFSINYPPTGPVTIYHPEFSINDPPIGPVAIYHHKLPSILDWQLCIYRKLENSLQITKIM